MNSPSPLTVFHWLVRDTFLQARASGLFWVLLGISGVVILLCLSVGVEGEGLRYDLRGEEFLPQGDPNEPAAKNPNTGVSVPGGEFTLAFGTIRFPLNRDVVSAVRFVHVLLAWGAADALGVLLALLWTAGFMPRFLDRHTAPLLLAKPVSFWQYVVGKYLGGLAFVGFHALVYFLGTWLALGVKTGVLDPTVHVSLFVLLVHFGVFYSVSILLAVLTRSTVASIFGTVVFWFVCWGTNYAYYQVAALPAEHAPSSLMISLMELCYWVLPKPADLGILLHQSLDAGVFFGQIPGFQAAVSGGHFRPILSVVTSVAFALVMLACAAHEFSTRDR